MARVPELTRILEENKKGETREEEQMKNNLMEQSKGRKRGALQGTLAHLDKR